MPNSQVPKCRNPHCGRTKDVDPESKLCNACSYSFNQGATSQAPATPSSISPSNPFTANMVSFPPAAMAAAPVVSEEMISNLSNQMVRGEEVDSTEMQKCMFGMMCNLVKNQNTARRSW